MECAQENARQAAIESLGVELCFSQVRANHFGALVPWLAAIVFLAPVATSAFWVWAVVLPVYVVLSFALHLAYLRRQPNDGDARRWGRYLLVHNVFMGLFTGLFPLLVDVGVHQSLIYLVVLLVVGPWFGAAVITAPHPPVFPLWIATQPLVLVSFLVQQENGQGPHWVLPALVVTALLASIVLWYHAARLNRRSIALRFDNLDLADRAQAAVRAKARFLAAVGHDLRQPLNALGLFHGALAAELDEARSRHLLTRAEQARTELQRLLDSLAEQARLEGGAVQVARHAFVLCPWLERLVEEVRPMAESSGLVLRLRCRCGVVDSDPHLLGRLLRNLLVNAVRHTRRGGIVVGVRRRGDRLRVTVWDTGPGIPTTQRRRVFDEFVRLGEGGEGQGLGLSIVRQLARVLDHPLHLNSRLGRGSAFSVDLPLIEPEPGWVLVVEDDATSREALVELLRREGRSVVAWDDAAELPATWPAPALVVSDYHLPRGTGVALVARLRRHYGPIPALLVSADPQAVEGCGLPCLSKPLEPRRLRRVVRRLLSQ